LETGVAPNPFYGSNRLTPKSPHQFTGSVFSQTLHFQNREGSAYGKCGGDENDYNTLLPTKRRYKGKDERGVYSGNNCHEGCEWHSLRRSLTFLTNCFQSVWHVIIASFL
jgi:hypothetical protein